MSAKAKSVFMCNACGAHAPKWAGQCAECGAWNTLEEAAMSAAPRGRTALPGTPAAAVQVLAEVRPEEAPRQSTGLGELDRVLGGGLVPGSVVLLGGDPGIGKSTLLLQALDALSARLPVLYVTGEESLRQVSLRAHRLGLAAKQLPALAEISVEAILEQARARQPRVMVVDSIQTVFTSLLQSAPGSVAQVRESAALLTRHAKHSGCALILVGHVTKEGALAGPRVLEHMVDTVLYFEGGNDGRYRMVRAIKNRFGAANELGLFAMLDTGLKEVSNPSAIFLSRGEQPVPGSVVMAAREGSRPLLLEVQALADDCKSGAPRRLALGLDGQRLAMLLAVLHRHGGVAMHDQDVFINVVGGVRVSETAADLPALLALVSSLRDRPLPRGLAAFGEVGLAGEIRPVPNGEERLREAMKHGFTRIVLPAANAPRRLPEGVELVAVKRLAEALQEI
jgi:DNA repair protein RadA/Sms